MNILEKVFYKFAVGLADVMYNDKNPVHETIGKPLQSLGDNKVKQEEKDQKLKDSNPALWAGKKVLNGTIKGITGCTISSI